jgi:LysM repeat protein
MVVTQTPDADGKIIHEVQAYQALYTIADAYHISVDRILLLNGLQADWPLQIGQKLVIDPGHVTPSPTLSNIQKLTPEADGRLYHTVHSGETLSWIARSGVGLILGVSTIVVIGALLWLRFARKR